MRRPTLRTAGLMAATVIVLGCSAASADGTASPTIKSSTPLSYPTQEPSPSRAASSPVPTPVASATPSSSAVEAKSLEIRWTTDDPHGLRNVTELVGIARAGDTYVLIANNDTTSVATAWWSTDGHAWHLAHKFPTDHQILTLTAVGAGFVATDTDLSSSSNATVWRSTDGREWAPVTDPSLSGAVIFKLVATAAGVVGFGRDAKYQSRIYTSPDGSAWLAATNESGLKVARGLHAVGAYGGRAVAFVSQGEGKPDAIWETSGRAEWTRTGALHEAVIVDLVAGGSRGWLALGANKAWTSVDGRSWTKGVPGPDVSADAIVDDAGYVVVGFIGSWPYDTCGDQRPFAGHTWTSADGQTWQQMPVSKEFTSATVLRLLVVDRTLIGLGVRLPDKEADMRVGQWTAPLPPAARPADASDKASKPVGCGG
jgi:hypothetical protein